MGAETGKFLFQVQHMNTYHPPQVQEMVWQKLVESVLKQIQIQLEWKHSESANFPQHNR